MVTAARCSRPGSSTRCRRSICPCRSPRSRRAPPSSLVSRCFGSRRPCSSANSSRRRSSTSSTSRPWWRPRRRGSATSRLPASRCWSSACAGRRASTARSAPAARPTSAAAPRPRTCRRASASAFPCAAPMPTVGCRRSTRSPRPSAPSPRRCRTTASCSSTPTTSTGESRTRSPSDGNSNGGASGCSASASIRATCCSRAAGRVAGWTRPGSRTWRSWSATTWTRSGSWSCGKPGRRSTPGGSAHPWSRPPGAARWGACTSCRPSGAPAKSDGGRCSSSAPASARRPCRGGCRCAGTALPAVRWSGT